MNYNFINGHKYQKFYKVINLKEWYDVDAVGGTFAGKNWKTLYAGEFDEQDEN